MSDLFRKQAIENQRERLEGKVLVIQPLSVTLLVALLVVVLAVAIAFLSTGEYARKEVVKGFLEPEVGLIKVYPPQTGILASLAVKEGDHITEGQALAVIVTPKTLTGKASVSRQQWQELQTQIQLLKQRITKEIQATNDETTRLQQEISSANHELASFKKQYQLVNARLAIAIQRHENSKQLYQKDLLSKENLDQLKDQELALESELQGITTQQLRQQALIEKNQLSIQQLPVQQAIRINQLNQEISQIKRQAYQDESSDKMMVYASASGMVSSIRHFENTQVHNNQPLLTILPQGSQLNASLLVPTRAAGFVKENQVARLRFDAFPHQRFGNLEGTISQVSSSVLLPDEANLPVRLEQPVYRIRVRLPQQYIVAYGREHFLKPGMLLEADLILEKRNLLTWLFEPIYSLRGKL